MKYAVIDVETTGGNAHSGRITEVGVYVVDGENIVDSFESLVNPECRVQPFVVRLTGISDEMLADAPKFYQIARKLVEITEGCTFVAHNAAFDYSFFRQEFANLGYQYKRPVLCTVKLAQKVMPGMPSYSLGKLCASLGIPIAQRHRAGGDALATVQLLQKLLAADPMPGLAALHPMLNKASLAQLPLTAGVYYFHDEKGKLLYIGKSRNIRNRVLQHFRNSVSPKAIEMRLSTAQVTFTETGSELLALLLESDEIKTKSPLYNRMLRRSAYKFGLYGYRTQAGYQALRLGRIKMSDRPLTVYGSYQEAIASVEALCSQYQLCSKLCGLYQSQGACFGHGIGKCQGACIGQEEPETYNQRAAMAVAGYKQPYPNMLIIDAGRDASEYAVVLVENHVYKGFGWMPADIQVSMISDLDGYLKPYADNRDVQQIIRSYVYANKPLKVIKF